MSGLGLGRMPLPPGYQSYTPPERRRQKRRAAARRAAGAAGADHGAARARGPAAKAGEGALSINSIGGVDYVPFLGVQRERLRGAVGASIASHALVVVLAFLVWTAPTPEQIVEERLAYIGMVWIPEAGPGGGGGGGGNESLEMPRPVEAVGEDDLTIPIDEPEEFEVPAEVEPEPEPLESTTLQKISAVPMAAAPRTRAGLLESLMARSLDSAGSGTGGGAGEGDGGGVGPGQGDGLGPGEGGGTGGGVYRPGNGVSQPQLVREVTPKYTTEAMRAKVQGTVMVEAVVLPDGTVGTVTIIRSLDPKFGLDEEALKAARQWRFRPGMRLGEPVAVRVIIALDFTIR